MKKIIPVGAAVGLLTVAFVGTRVGDDAPTEAESDLPAMTASLVQPRWSEGTREVGVRLTNLGAAELTVESVRLVWSRLPEAPTTPKDVELPPDRTLDLATTLGSPDCTGYPTSRAEPPAARVELAGHAEPITVTLDDHGHAWLRRLYAGECDAAALQAVADVRLLDRWSRIEVGGVPYLRGWIALDRNTAGEPVTVTSLLGSVILSFEPMRPGRPIGTLGPDQQALRIPVRMGSTNRCDAHALGGSTQTFLLSAFVRHGEAPAHRVILIPDEATKGWVLEVVHDACAARSGAAAR